MLVVNNCTLFQKVKGLQGLLKEFDDETFLRSREFETEGLQRDGELTFSLVGGLRSVCPISKNFRKRARPEKRENNTPQQNDRSVLSNKRQLTCFIKLLKVQK